MKKSLLFSIPLVIILASCGGGGGGSSTPTPSALVKIDSTNAKSNIGLSL